MRRNTNLTFFDISSDIERYSDLNTEIADLFEKVEAFDAELL